MLFTLKYIFQRRPFQFLTASILLSLAVFSYVLHVVEYDLDRDYDSGSVQLWDMLWLAYSTLCTVGWGDVVPRTVPGRLITMVLSWIGLGIIAMLTATFCSHFELDKNEIEMLTKLDAKQLRDQMRPVAADFIRAKWRLRKLGAGAGAHRGKRATLRFHMATKSRRLRKLLQRRQNKLDGATNIKVLHGEVLNFRSNVQAALDLNTANMQQMREQLAKQQAMQHAMMHEMHGLQEQMRDMQTHLAGPRSGTPRASCASSRPASSSTAQRPRTFLFEATTLHGSRPSKVGISWGAEEDQTLVQSIPQDEQLQDFS